MSPLRDPWQVEDPWSDAASVCPPSRRTAALPSSTTEQKDTTLLAHAIIKGLADGAASRQVAAATASAIMRARDHPSIGAANMQIKMTEHIRSTVEAEYGGPVGISQVCKDLKASGKGDLARSISNQNRCRNLAAHPPCDLNEKLQSALRELPAAYTGQRHPN